MELVGGTAREPTGHRLHRLALAGEQEAGEVGAGVSARVLSPRPNLEEVRERLEEFGETIVPEAEVRRWPHPEESVEGE
jgi:hypothetical protein